MSINARLLTALAVVLIAVGVAAVVTSRIAVERYFQETSQEINQNLAMYVVDRLPLLEDSGVVNETALKELADTAMTVNPSVEVYLLDADGTVLDHVLPPETVQLRRVALPPIKQYLTDGRTLPILGDDPRNPDLQKAFSAWPIRHNDAVTGYLYVVLGGQKFASAVDMFAGSYVLRVAGWTLLIAVGVGLLVGAVLFRQVTTPLIRLKKSMVTFANGDFQTKPEPLPGANTSEVRDLNNAFDQLGERLTEQLERLKETDDLRRELIANVSHDLRTPLASMQGYVESLLIKDVSLSQSERREMLGIAHRHTKQLNHLVQELFELAKLEAGSVEPQFERFSLMELLQDVVQEFQLEARERNIDLSFEPAPNDVWVVADISLIQRALSNLINNALRYTRDEGAIVVHITAGKKDAMIDVTDNGPGIPADELDHIFDRFYRAPSNATRDGSGLGLAIVKRIVELHGSQVAVESRVQHGTKFSFGLPMNEPVHPPDDVRPPAARKSGSTRAAG